jgi:branched-chain amino acid transport system substrate-binding protein
MKLRSLVLVTTAVVIVAACGQKAGVRGSSTTGTGTGTGGGTTVAAGDRTGITDQEIVVGLHIPVTGAAAIPQQVVADGAALYFDFINQRGGVNGRKIRLVYEDDHFDANAARQACQKMVEQDHVFLLFGAAGADQIIACARYANGLGIPYFSAGVNQDEVQGLSTYFASSETYPQQSGQIVQIINNRVKKKNLGIVVEDTPSFGDAHNSIVAAARQGGLNVVADDKIDKSADQAQALAEIQRLKAGGADVIYVLLSPIVFLNLTSAAAGQLYSPQWIGPGITNGVDLVAQIGCPGVNGALFLSPFPELDVIDQLDPDYQAAYRSLRGKAGDDIGLGLWGGDRGLAAALQAAGRDLTRQSFIKTLEMGQSYDSHVFPPVAYSPTNHFGSSEMNLLQADCGSKTFKTVVKFASSF